MDLFRMSFSVDDGGKNTCNSDVLGWIPEGDSQSKQNTSPRSTPTKKKTANGKYGVCAQGPTTTQGASTIASMIGAKSPDSLNPIPIGPHGFVKEVKPRHSTGRATFFVLPLFYRE